MLITSINKNGNLRMGSRGPTVKKLQECLLKAGYDLGKWKADGIWGKDTDKGFRAFQKNHNLIVDGIAGPLSLYELMWYNYPHFRKSEFRCKCGRYCNGYPVRVDENLLVLLEKLRKEAGNKPVIINSGLRCKNHNKNVGGSSGSQHLKGTAADIKVFGVSAAQVYNIANKINPKGGVGRYSNYTHVDTRGKRARWDYR